jgi:hypothetical protein
MIIDLVIGIDDNRFGNRDRRINGFGNIYKTKIVN